MRGISGLLMVCALASPAMAGGDAWRELPADEYLDKVYANWLGQCIGNIYGLRHENKYREEPPQEDIPLVYEGWPLEAMQRENGAFSDDDTDIEYMYLFLMEEKGVEPTWEQVARRWERHVNHHIWVANYSARTLMSRGWLPPDTGRRGLNSNWFQIDPQLVNEVWAVTAPGMVRYAAAKSDWAARVTNDDYGTHPTIWYGAMYAEAFFEPDVRRLFEAGLAHTPPGRFRDALVLVRALHARFPDWRDTRRILRDLYWTHEPPATKSIVAATVNGALGALALLYGEGDFRRTLFLSCMAGFDCDNQAATLAGLLGVAGGTRALPRDLLLPVEGWTKPFNDRYAMVSRDHLPDATLTGMADRTRRLGEKVILRHGGEIVERDGRRVYRIRADAEFEAPLEVRIHPVDPVRRGEALERRVSVVGGRGDARVVGVRGRLPRWVFAEGDALRGTAKEPGRFALEVVVRTGDGREAVVGSDLVVLPDNLALRASRVLARVTRPTGGGEKSLEVLRDGRRYAGSYDSFDGEEPAEEDWFGYEWEEPVTVSQVVYVAGERHRNGGWWESFSVEARDARGAWRPVEGLRQRPEVVVPWNWPLRPYTLTFEPISTRALRIVGKPGGTAGFASVAELEVYGEAVLAP